MKTLRIKNKLLITLASLCLGLSMVCDASQKDLDSNYALIVIDMQPEFVSINNEYLKLTTYYETDNKLIYHQKQMIQLAIDHKLPILFVEYKGFKNTIPQLTSLTKGYKEIKFFKKSDDSAFVNENGKIDKYLRSKKIKNLIIVGVNGNACVQASIEDACRKKYNIIAYNRGIRGLQHTPYYYEKTQINYCSESNFLQFADIEEVSKLLAKRYVTQENLGQLHLNL